MQLRSDARVNRVRIIDAATEVFAEKGIGTEIKDIADRAGVAVGTLYNHFSGKDDLLQAIVRAACADLVEGARMAEAEPDPLAALHALLTHAFTAATRYGWLAEALLGGRLPTPFQAELRAELDEHGFHTRFERTIRRAQAAGGLRADLDCPAAAAMLGGATTPWICRRFVGDRSPAEATDLLMTVFLRGAAPEHCG